MHLGGNRCWESLSFENNNNNKRYPTHKFYFIVSSAVSSIQVHIAEARFCLFPMRKILVLPHQFGQHIVE